MRAAEWTKTLIFPSIYSSPHPKLMKAAILPGDPFQGDSMTEHSARGWLVCCWFSHLAALVTTAGHTRNPGAKLYLHELTVTSTHLSSLPPVLPFGKACRSERSPWPTPVLEARYILARPRGAWEGRGVGLSWLLPVELSGK